ncbi:MAG: DUF739 family protein [Turicibacter sp.]
MNKNKLKGKIVECGFTYKKMANFLGVSETTFTAKINGKTKFSIDEAKELSARLCLNEDEILKIFFDKKLAKTQ